MGKSKIAAQFSIAAQDLATGLGLADTHPSRLHAGRAQRASAEVRRVFLMEHHPIDLSRGGAREATIVVTRQCVPELLLMIMVNW